MLTDFFTEYFKRTGETKVEFSESFFTNLGINFSETVKLFQYCGLIDVEGKPTQRGIDTKIFTGNYRETYGKQ